MLQEINGDQLKTYVNEAKAPLLVYFYTPFCGTCAAAERMLSITLEAIPGAPHAVSCNINFTPGLAESWQISSVPCLIVIDNDKITEKIYAFQSVDRLFRFIKPYT
jgi:thioredoxin-like negative regulator of GroEL